MPNFIESLRSKLVRPWQSGMVISTPILWAMGLVIGGLLLLIWNLDLLAPYEPLPQLLLALLFGAIAVGFFTKRLGMTTLWRFIPGWIMASLSLMMLLSVANGVPGPVAAGLLFLGVAAAFGHIYLLDRLNHWWALLSAGFNLVTFMMVAATSWTSNLTIFGTLLFGGMGLVFIAVYWFSPSRQHWWSLIPGTVLFLFGLVLLTAGPEEQRSFIRWWPVLFVVAGLGIAWFSESGQNSKEQQASTFSPAMSPSTAIAQPSGPQPSTNPVNPTQSEQTSTQP